MTHTPQEQDSRPAPDRPFELREVVDAEGITVELIVEEERLFSGRVRNADLAEMLRLLRLAREDVVAELGRDLVARFEQERARVSLSSPVLASGSDGHGDRFVSRYVMDGGAGPEVGIAWYDISSRSVGPDHAPALVRSRMRYDVERRLAETRPSTLQILRGVLDGMST